MSHTPGPWEVVDTSTSSGFSRNWREIRSAGKNQSVVSVGEYTSSRDGVIAGVIIGEANARLIAAAPDLFAACKELRAFLTEVRFHPGDMEVYGNVFSAVEAAIEKAEGRS